MTHKNNMIIRGLHHNNLKNISLDIPKESIVVFTGVSGSGKSSIVFDTIAAESQRQMKETYPTFIRSRLPKYEKPKVDKIENLAASVIIDQSRLGGNARSTVGTISDLYAWMRLLFSRIGTPYVGAASCFSFNNPSGMCRECSGLGHTMEIDMSRVLMADRSLRTDMIDLPGFHPGNWYWKQYCESGLFDLDKKWQEYTKQEQHLLLYGAYEPGGERIHPKVEGIYQHLSRLLLKRDLTNSSDTVIKRLRKLVQPRICPKCHGKRLNEAALSCLVEGYSIDELCNMEFKALIEVLKKIEDARVQTILETMIASLQRMIDIGLSYLSLHRETASLSGGEAQRLKLVRYMGSSLSGLLYIFDEPSTGMHPSDVYRMNHLLENLRDKGNSVIVVEHDKDVIAIADEIIDVGPEAGKHGGEILFQGTYKQLLLADTITAKALRRQVPVKKHPRKPKAFLTIHDAHLHNLKHVSVKIPLQVLTVVSGVAGSGKSTLIREVFARQYADRVIMVDQSAITATGRSTPATYLGFFDDIRKIMAQEHQVEAAMFSFNSKGACPTCQGRGVVTTELVFMDPITTTCEDCGGKRYSKEALSYRYQGLNIHEIMELSVEDALPLFQQHAKIRKGLQALQEVGLSYMSLGQPLATLSGGERQRVKLAKHLRGKGNIYVLDEPTTGLHARDVEHLLQVFEGFVEQGNTVIVIEHHVDVMKQADYIIDVGPYGGNAGGEVVFFGTPQEMIAHSDTLTAQYLRQSLKEDC